MAKPQPIETAPRDGTVILTDEGLALFAQPSSWDSDERFPQWLTCDAYGQAFLSSSETEISCFPTKWTPLPDWMKK